MTKEELFEIIVNIVALPNSTLEQQKRIAIHILLAFDEYASWHWQDQEDIATPWVNRSELDFEELCSKILNKLDEK